MTCTGVYGLTQVDLDAGKVVNTATVTGIGRTRPRCRLPGP